MEFPNGLICTKKLGLKAVEARLDLFAKILKVKENCYNF
jgi:hypothetical protein